MPRRSSKATTLSYTNRTGRTYFLHEGKTKTGKPRYFVAKSVRDGALAAMPNGYEFSESINGVVSVRRVSTTGPKIPDVELAMVRAGLACHHHLHAHRAEAVKGEIVVFEPAGGMDRSEIEAVARALFTSPDLLEARLTRGKPKRYDPVMKFVPAEPPGHYAVHRMTYRSDGGWSWPLAVAPLPKLVPKFIKHLGTEALFELM